MPRQFELLIVGAGPAGIACAVQASRDGVDLLLVGDEAPGGLVRAAHRLDNLPGFPTGIGGDKFAALLAEHLAQRAIDFRRDRVVSCVVDAKGRFCCQTEAGEEFCARTLVLAAGTRPRPFPVPGFAAAVDQGRVHRDVRQLAEDMSARQVAIVGGGEAAVDSALSVRRRGGDVLMYVRGRDLKSPRSLTAEARAAGVRFCFGWKLARIDGRNDHLALGWQTHEGQTTTTADYLVACVGREPRRELLAHLPLGRIEVLKVETLLPGLFLAGDLIHEHDRFTATALGDGQRAARLAMKYLRRPAAQKQTSKRHD